MCRIALLAVRALVGHRVVGSIRETTTRGDAPPPGDSSPDDATEWVCSPKLLFRAGSRVGDPTKRSEIHCRRGRRIFVVVAVELVCAVSEHPGGGRFETA